jgi:hypothetical protein
MKNPVRSGIGAKGDSAGYVLSSLYRGTATDPCPLSGLDGFAFPSFTLLQAASDFKRCYRAN